MTKARRSGYLVNTADVPVILGMINRGDRRHDIAAWFGLNQGRIAEVENGKHGSPPFAAPHDLLPAGSPGPKARDLIAAMMNAHRLASADKFKEALQVMEKAVADYDKSV